MIKSPLRYPGGKSRAIKYLKDFVPKFNELREPFFGGGSVALYYAQMKPNAMYKVSDLNFELFCFWDVLKKHPQKLIEEVQKVYNKWEDGKRLFKTILERRNNKLSNLQRAVDFYVLNRITFSGVVDSGGYSEGAFQKRFTQSSIDRLSPTSKVIQQIEFYNEDYNYLLSLPGDKVFIFLDPPYFKAQKSKLYGKNGNLHLNFDHVKFYEDLKKCHHKWMITYDNSDYIRELFSGFYIQEWQLQYGMNNYKRSYAEKGNELLIANYDLAETKFENTAAYPLFNDDQ
jgi:DNA adenine methylase